MDKIIKDNFITNQLGTISFIVKNLKKKSDFLEISKLKKPFFLTIKNKKKLSKRNQKKLNAILINKSINFEKKSLNKEKIILSCREANKNDATQVKKICSFS